MDRVEELPGGSPLEVSESSDLRSRFIRQLVLDAATDRSVADGRVPPRVLVQFWDDAAAVPADVQACLASWAPLEDLGFRRLLFDDTTAHRFIATHFSSRRLAAFQRCQHPAMRADYFRLCFVLKHGGLYIDADDVYQGMPIVDLIADGRLALQPLCYDIATGSMVDPVNAARTPGYDRRIFYVNNTPLAAPSGHQLIAKALDRATSLVLSAADGNRDVQSLTGPGNLTAALVAHALEQQHAGASPDFKLRTDWSRVARSRWRLGYRSDNRNWRHWMRGGHG